MSVSDNGVYCLPYIALYVSLSLCVCVCAFIICMCRQFCFHIRVIASRESRVVSCACCYLLSVLSVLNSIECMYCVGLCVLCAHYCLCVYIYAYTVSQKWLSYECLCRVSCAVRSVRIWLRNNIVTLLLVLCYGMRHRRGSACTQYICVKTTTHETQENAWV